MKKFNFLKVLGLVLASTIVLSSCSKSEEEQIPANTIVDSDGIILELNWDTGGTISQALQEADLDLILKRADGTKISQTYATSSFDNLTIPGHFSDETYLIDISVYDIEKDVDFEIIARGTSDGATKNVVFDGNLFVAADGETLEEFIFIKKTGSTFEIGQ